MSQTDFWKIHPIVFKSKNTTGGELSSGAIWGGAKGPWPRLNWILAQVEILLPHNAMGQQY